MTLLATKIAELVDQLISSQEDYVLWRGLLNTQTWKIVVHRAHPADPYRIIVNAEKRDSSDGDPE